MACHDGDQPEMSLLFDGTTEPPPMDQRPCYAPHAVEQRLALAGEARTVYNGVNSAHELRT